MHVAFSGRVVDRRDDEGPVVKAEVIDAAAGDDTAWMSPFAATPPTSLPPNRFRCPTPFFPLIWKPASNTKRCCVRPLASSISVPVSVKRLSFEEPKATFSKDSQAPFTPPTPTSSRATTSTTLTSRGLQTGPLSCKGVVGGREPTPSSAGGRAENGIRTQAKPRRSCSQAAEQSPPGTFRVVP